MTAVIAERARTAALVLVVGSAASCGRTELDDVRSAGPNGDAAPGGDGSREAGDARAAEGGSDAPSVLRFAPPRAISLQKMSRFVGVGDFNRDGTPDLAVVHEVTPGNVSILVGKGGADFAPVRVLDVGESGPAGLAIHDLDGDGDEDLAIANRVSGTITVATGHGDGTFAPTAVLRLAPGGGTFSVKVGDLDGDGIIDLAAALRFDNKVAVVPTDGRGVYQVGRRLTIPVGAGPNELTLADLDGDGRLDIATANLMGANVSVLQGPGLGPLRNQGVASQPISVAAADFDQDGRLDLVSANYAAKSISILLGQGAGKFSPHVDHAVGNEPYYVAPADFDGDGREDLGVANSSAGTVSILLGDGSGGFAPAVDLKVATPEKFGLVCLAPADLDGNGTVDLAVANLSGEIILLLNETR